MSANFIPRQLPQLTDSAGVALPDVSASELGHLAGVTSAIQTQIDYAAPKFGGYSPAKLAEATIDPCCATGNWTLVSSPASRATLTADTTNYKCSDGTNFQSLKITFTGAADRAGIVKNLSPAVDFRGKHLGVDLYVPVGSGLSSYSYISSVRLFLSDASSNYRGYYLYYVETGSNEEIPGWHSAYCIPSSHDQASATPADLSAITQVELRVSLKYQDITYPLSVSFDRLFSVTPPSSGHVLMLHEAGYALARQIAAYMKSLGLRTNISVDPYRAAGLLGTPGTYLTFAEVYQLKRDGHFIYIYPGHGDYDGICDTGAWGSASDDDKLQSIKWCRQELKKYGLLDSLGECCFTIPGSGWNAYDESLVGTEMLYVPSNHGMQRTYNLRSQNATMGHVGFSIGSIKDSLTTLIANAATDKALLVLLDHCQDSTYVTAGKSAIDACIAAGLKFITIPDLLQGRL
jgi:hypothetical protein